MKNSVLVLIIFASIIYLNASSSAQNLENAKPFNGYWASQCIVIKHKPRAFSSTNSILLLKDGQYHYSEIAYVDNSCKDELMKINTNKGKYKIGQPQKRKIKNKEVHIISFIPSDPFNGNYGELNEEIYGNVVDDTLNINISKYEMGMELSEILKFQKK